MLYIFIALLKQEELEMARLTISFVESHAFELEEKRNQEIKKREKLEQDYKVCKEATKYWLKNLYVNSLGHLIAIDLSDLSFFKCVVEVQCISRLTKLSI